MRAATPVHPLPSLACLHQAGLAFILCHAPTRPFTPKVTSYSPTTHRRHHHTTMSEPKTFELEDLQKHTSREDIWLLVSGKVYDVTGFLDEHPGGDEVLLEEAGE